MLRTDYRNSGIWNKTIDIHAGICTNNMMEKLHNTWHALEYLTRGARTWFPPDSPLSSSLTAFDKVQAEANVLPEISSITCANGKIKITSFFCRLYWRQAACPDCFLIASFQLCHFQLHRWRCVRTAQILHDDIELTWAYMWLLERKMHRRGLSTVPLTCTSRRCQVRVQQFSQTSILKIWKTWTGCDSMKPTHIMQTSDSLACGWDSFSSSSCASTAPIDSGHHEF